MRAYNLGRLPWGSMKCCENTVKRDQVNLGRFPRGMGIWMSLKQCRGEREGHSRQRKSNSKSTAWSSLTEWDIKRNGEEKMLWVKAERWIKVSMHECRLYFLSWFPQAICRSTEWIRNFVGKMKIGHYLKLPPEGTIGEDEPAKLLSTSPVPSRYFKSSSGHCDSHSASLRDHCSIQWRTIWGFWVG